VRTTHRTIALLRTAVLTVAATGAMVLGMSTVANAAWNDSAPIGTDSVTTGSLGIDPTTISGGSWTKDGSAFDPTTGRLTAGTALVYTVPDVSVTAVGTNLEASFRTNVGGAVVPNAIKDHVTVTLASTPSTIKGSESDAAGKQAVTLRLTVSADAGLPTSAQTIDLSDLTVTLRNSYGGWTDTAALDAGTVTSGAPVAPGGTVTLNFSALATDSDQKIGFYLTDPGPGTKIYWNDYGPDGEIVTDAQDGLNEYDYSGKGKSTAWVRIVGTFRGLGSANQTAEQIGALTHVEGWTSDTGSTSARYAFKNAVHLANIDTLPSTLTDTAYAFQNAGSANAPSAASFELVGWDSSHVTTMAHMFDGATNYKQYDPTWDTSSVTDMSYMFANTVAFEGPIKFSTTARVTTMEGMFKNATGYAGSTYTEGEYIQAWDTSRVTNMSFMFDGATAFNRRLDLWDTSNVTTMESMFRGATAFDQELSDWDTGSVRNMSSMFRGASSFNRDLVGWDTSSVTDMSFMFAETQSFRGDVRQWDLSSVTTMAHMFENSHFDYYSLGVTGGDPYWDVSNVQDMSFMFAGSSYNKSLADWDASSVTNMTSMFAGATSFNQDLSGWTLNAGVVHDDFNTGANPAWVANAAWQPQWPGARAAAAPADEPETAPATEPAETPSSTPTATPDPTPTTPSDDAADPAGTDDAATDPAEDTAPEDTASDDASDDAPDPCPTTEATDPATTGTTAEDDATTTTDDCTDAPTTEDATPTPDPASSSTVAPTEAASEEGTK